MEHKEKMGRPTATEVEQGGGDEDPRWVGHHPPLAAPLIHQAPCPDLPPPWLDVDFSDTSEEKNIVRFSIKGELLLSFPFLVCRIDLPPRVHLIWLSSLQCWNSRGRHICSTASA